MNNFSKNVATLMVATFFYGCLDFGKDINIVSPYVTSRELEIVSKRTGIIFPVGTTGLGYFFQGSGIDDAIALKIIVPEDKKKIFMENEIFKSGKNSKPSLQIGRSKAWWKLDDIDERIDRTKQLPKGRYMEVSIGEEDSICIAYISWMST